MASYIESTLNHDERILYIGRLSLWSLAGLIVPGVLLLPLVVGLIPLVGAFVRYRSTELAITNRRTIAKFGFLSVSTIEINLARVESVQVRQSMFGRIFDFGTLIISGAGNPQEPVPGISKPLQFRRALGEAQQSLAAALAPQTQRTEPAT